MNSAPKVRIRLDLSYDGTHFEGWQRQKEGRTVQGVLEGTLGILHKGQTIQVVGSGRTDSGVHANHQVAHFESSASIPPDRFSLALNSQLPQDIRIHKSRQVESAFHARHDARVRIYRYYLIRPEDQRAHMRPYSTVYLHSLSLPRLNGIVSSLVGTHDFTAFAARGDSSENKVRTVYSARFLREGPFTVFRIAGNAFLWRMVRSIVGTVLMVYERGGREEEFRTILEGKEREKAGPSSIPRGLFLDRIIYGTEGSLY